MNDGLSPIDGNKRRFLIASGLASLTSIAGCIGKNQSYEGTQVQQLPRPTRGSPDAEITVQVFVDLMCPHCAKWEEEVLPQLMSEYVDTGVITIEHFDYPIPVTNLSIPAAAGARAVQKNVGVNEFFEYVRIVFENQDSQTKQSLIELGVEMGVSQEEMEYAVNLDKYNPVVNRDKQYGESRGVQGTPSVFVGGLMVEEPSFDAIRAAIENSR